MENPRKRKQCSASGQSSTNLGKDDEKIYKKIKLITQQINQSLLTVADVAYSSSNLKTKLYSGETVLSWRNKNPKLISKCGIQLNDDCWAWAFAGGLFARMSKDGGQENVLPTPKALLDQIDHSLLTDKKALPISLNAAPSILRDYGYQMIQHRRPSLKYPVELDKFEKFIERRTTILPLAACFPYVPSYVLFDSKPGDQKVFRPSLADLFAMKTEKIDDHCALITGSGAVWIDGEYVEFWQMKETRGTHFADQGFTRLERHKGLVRDVFEFVQQ